VSAINAAARRSNQGSTAVLALLMLTACLLLFAAGRHLTFFYDEWDFILGRRGHSVATYLNPNNGHLVLFPVLVYKLLFELVGLRHYWPYRAVSLSLHLLCVALLYVIVRRRVGGWYALIPAVLLLFMGSAFQDLLWPFEMGWFASVAGGLGALAVLERRGASRDDALAAALLVWSLTGSAVGLAFLAAAVAQLTAKRWPWRRWWVVALPAALYGIWFVGWGTSQHVNSDSVLSAPQYVANAAAGMAAGLAGQSSTWGPPLAVALFVGVAIGLGRRAPEARLDLALTASVGLLVFWLLTALARADSAPPDSSRYLYIGAAFFLLIASETGVLPAIRGSWLLLAGLLLLGAIVGNIDLLRSGERGLRPIDQSVRASLAAVELAAPVVAPAFVAEPINAPQISAGPYLAAVRDLGSPALTLTELEHASETTREASDEVLQRAERLAAVPASRPVAGTGTVVSESVAGGRLRAAGPCVRLDPVGRVASLSLRELPGSTLYLLPAAGPAANVYARRFGSLFTASVVGSVAGGSGAVIRLPDDRAPQRPWHLQLVTQRSTLVCAR
jgi:hypothetical protein